MATLTQRAEQALLGALIINPSQIDDMPYLAAVDLADPRHHAILAALSEIHAEIPRASGTALAELVTARTGGAGVTVPYLTGLAESCPDPGAAAVYGRMAEEASLRRMLAVHAEALTQEAGTGPEAGTENEHLVRLAEAMKSHSRNFDAADRQGDSTGSDTGPDAAPRQEELLLAGLVQHPERVSEITGWLDPEVFTSPGLRRIYEAIVAVERYGEPVTELTLSWELARSTATERTMNPQGSDYAQSPWQPGPGYLSRLSEMTVDAGSLPFIGRDLLAAQVRAELDTNIGQLRVQSPPRVTELRTSHISHETGHDAAGTLKPPGHGIGQDDRRLDWDRQ